MLWETLITGRLAMLFLFLPTAGLSNQRHVKTPKMGAPKNNNAQLRG